MMYETKRAISSAWVAPSMTKLELIKAYDEFNVDTGLIELSLLNIKKIDTLYFPGSNVTASVRVSVMDEFVATTLLDSS